MPRIWIANVTYKTESGETESTQAAICSQTGGIAAALQEHLAQMRCQFVSVSDAVDVMTIAQNGKLTAELSRLSRSAHPGRPVVLERQARAPAAGNGSLQAPLPSEQDAALPEPPILIIFNTPDALQLYEMLSKDQTPFVNISSFRDSGIPCTIGVPFDSWNNEAEKICEGAGDAYIFSRANRDFIDTSGRPITEMLIDRRFTLNNPFDPSLIRSAQRKEYARSDPFHFMVFSDGGFDIVDRTSFELKVCKHLDEAISRVVELAAQCALAAMFMQAKYMPVSPPNHIRIASGVIKWEMYADFAGFQETVKDDVIDIAMQEIRKSGSILSYTDVLRICRAMAMAHETGRTKFAISRWGELQASERMDQAQRVRQFEIEITSLHIREAWYLNPTL